MADDSAAKQLELRVLRHMPYDEEWRCTPVQRDDLLATVFSRRYKGYRASVMVIREGREGEQLRIVGAVPSQRGEEHLYRSAVYAGRDGLYGAADYARSHECPAVLKFIDSTLADLPQQKPEGREGN